MRTPWTGQDAGFTLLETVLAIFLYGILVLCAGNLMMFAGRHSASLLLMEEHLENGRAAMELMRSHIEQARELVLLTDDQYMLKELRVSIQQKNGTDHVYLFHYDSSLGPASVRWRRLEYGGNELASDVTHVYCMLDEQLGLLYVEIAVGETALGNRQDSLVLKTTLSVGDKTISAVAG